MFVDIFEDIHLFNIEKNRKINVENIISVLSPMILTLVPPISRETPSLHTNPKTQAPLPPNTNISTTTSINLNVWMIIFKVNWKANVSF